MVQTTINGGLQLPRTVLGENENVFKGLNLYIHSMVVY